MGSEPSKKPARSDGVGSEPGAKSVTSDASAESSAASQAREAQAAAFEPTAAGVPSDPIGWNGRVLDDRYRILRLLGEGGMGAVFVAEHLTLHKAVAIKVVRAELVGNGEVAARFAREAMATAQFEHPHVASAIDYGTLPEGGAYFVMQLVRGRSLRGLLGRDKGGLPWRRACEIAAQVADALSAARAAGIIHRDLKPDNILVEQREDGSDLVKILDFGIAHVAPRDVAAPGAQSHRELTRVGTVMGTPGYMSPEQAVGDKVDHRTDLYALGVVLWECIAGRELWDGPDLTSVITRQLAEPVPLLRSLVSDSTLHVDLDALVQRLTARAAVERPEHAAEVRDTLRRLAHTRAPDLGFGSALASLHTWKPSLRRALTRYRSQPPLLRRVQVGAALALLLLAVTLGLAFNSPREQHPGTILARAARAATRVLQNTSAQPPAPTLPPELVKDSETLVEGKSVRERRTAADKILGYQPQERVFPHLLVLAKLEIARGCKPRKEMIAKMKEQADPRYLPALRRLDRAPKSGCGFLSLSDCYGCVRSEVSDAIDAIEQRQMNKERGEKP